MKRLKLISSFILALALVCTFLPFGNVHAEGFEDNAYVYINDVDNPVTVLQIKYELTVFDEEDGDLTDQIYVVLDNYTGNETVLGDFLIVFGVTDSGGTEVTVAITVRNVDVTAPEFVVDVESSLNIPQYSYLPSYLPRISAIDGHDGDITSEVEITGLELIDTEVLGEYSLIYSVTDSTGNQTVQTFIVKVVDSTAPVLTGPNEIIKRSDTILDGTFYLSYFSAEDDHDGIVSNRIEVITDEYIGNANNPGTYTIVISVSDTQGNFTNHTIKIKVVKDMIPRLIIDKYYWVVENDHLVTDDEFISILKGIDDLPNYTYIFTTTYDNYSNFFERLDKYQKSFSLLSSSGEEFERDIILDVVPGDSNIVDPSPGFFKANSNLILGVIAAVLLLTVFIVGAVKSK